MSADMKAADKKFFTYANQLLADCEAKGRPTYPLHKVINVNIFMQNYYL